MDTKIRVCLPDCLLENASAVGGLPKPSGVRIEKSARVFGGDINTAFSLTLSNGQTVFMKANNVENADFFSAETNGLLALAQAASGSGGAISVAKPLAHGRCDFALEGISGEFPGGKFSFLLLEFIESASDFRGPVFWEKFGRGLAALHLADTSSFLRGSFAGEKPAASKTAAESFGFFEDNYIGSTRQKNSARSSWIDFFRDCRLLPQIKMAQGYFDQSFLKKCAAFLSRLDRLLEEPRKPALLHGDLWSGNVICGANGEPYLIDPAVYVGHCEADLAMTQLFGQFPQSFYAAYNEVNPIEKEFGERKDIYNLYQLLNHLNLFGAGYLGKVQAVVGKYL